MKKMMSSWGLFGLALATMLTSCVAKKKYVEAQNTITELREQNAQCMQRGDSLNQSLSMLQQSNNDLQRRYDSTSSAYTSMQSRYGEYSSYYDKNSSTAQALHQELHQQLDQSIGANNIAVSGQKVFITLPETSLFSGSSTTLSSKGKDIINMLATTISQHPDVEVNVATHAMYNSGAMSGWNNANSVNNDQMNNQSVTEEEVKIKTDNPSDLNTNPAVKKSTVKKSYNTGGAKTTYKKKSTGTKYKSETARRTMKSNYASGRTVATSSSSSLAISRASTIVSALKEQGVSRAGIQLTDPKGTKVFSRKYQVIVSPAMDGYYEMMDKNSGGTGMK